MKLICKVLILFIIPLCLFAKEINVYLRFDDPNLLQTVKQFNDYLESKSILSRYNIEPFLGNHPMHITLYLTAYPEKNLVELKQRVAAIARTWPAIGFKTTNIFLTAGNYVMLDLDMARQEDGQNHLLQQLSDKVIFRLSNLRDFNAKIPDWAESIPEKKKAFMRYGSPNVFFEFSPHFSLMAKNFSDPVEQQAFQREMKQLIGEYDFPEMNISSAVIGVGYVNSFGQVTEELAAYPLGHSR